MKLLQGISYSQNYIFTYLLLYSVTLIIINLNFKLVKLEQDCHKIINQYNLFKLLIYPSLLLYTVKARK